VGVTNTKPDLVVLLAIGVVNSTVEMASTIGDGVALKERVGAGVVGARVTSSTNKGPLLSALRSGLQATSIINKTKAINGRLPILNILNYKVDSSSDCLRQAPFVQLA
jgi:hypothetical protein